jgi:hypothetical protein
MVLDLQNIPSVLEAAADKFRALFAAMGASGNAYTATSTQYLAMQRCDPDR